MITNGSHTSAATLNQDIFPPSLLKKNSQPTEQQTIQEMVLFVSHKNEQINY